MDNFLQELDRLAQTGPLIEQFNQRITRTTVLYIKGHLPRDSWRHLMIQSLVTNVSDFNSEELIAKIEVNSVIHRMLQADEQTSN
jgi:hypothetical protein